MRRAGLVLGFAAMAILAVAMRPSQRVHRNHFKEGAQWQVLRDCEVGSLLDVVRDQAIEVFPIDIRVLRRRSHRDTGFHAVGRQNETAQHVFL